MRWSIGAAVIITLLKAFVVWALFRVTCAKRGDALRAGSVLTGASEFAFVLLPLAAGLGIVSATQGSLLSAIAAITLLLGPLFASLADVVLRRFAAPGRARGRRFRRREAARCW